MPWFEILAIVLVLLFILSGPILWIFFGQEDGCGRTLWQRIIGKKDEDKKS